MDFKVAAGLFFKRCLRFKVCAGAYRHPARRLHGFFHTKSFSYDLLFAYSSKSKQKMPLA
jgi:hypothetical protein